MTQPSRARLEARTRRLHDRLESSLHIGGGGAGRREVIAYLRAARGWFETVDAQVWGRPWPPRLRADERRGKVAWIDEDLLRLGCEPSPIPAAPAVAVPVTTAPLLGVAYVIEGAMLGGRVLARRFAGVAGTPLRFFTGYGAETGSMWAGLLEEIERSSAGRGDELEQMASAASAAFLSIETWMIEQRVASPGAA